MKNLGQEILAIIRQNPGIKAKEIALRLDLERRQVNAILYGALKGSCYQDSSYQWYVAEYKKLASNDRDDKPAPDQ